MFYSLNNNELVISSTEQGERIALMQDRRLLEYHEDTGADFNVGDVVLGLVKKVNSGLNACFVDIGHEREAFLHYPDLGPQVKSLLRFTNLVQQGKLQNGNLSTFRPEADIEKLGKIVDIFTKGQTVPVQIVKEPISSKGYRLTTEISLPGRYLVLVPFGDSVSISKKIEDREERSRLLKLLKQAKPAGMGVIIRTVAEGYESEEITHDLAGLVARWEILAERLRTAEPKTKLVSEVSKAGAMLRDLLNDSFDSITVDTRENYNEVKTLLREIAPDKERIVRLHNAKMKLFEAAGVERQLKPLFGKTVSLPGGGYLVIEHTEAMHVVDVNSGSSTSKSGSEDYEANSFKVNVEAAQEMARQLRLRDIGGIVIIDFIDMRKMEYRRQLSEIMEEAMAADRARHTILPLSKFGLMQITRQRVKPQTNMANAEVCPTCNGTGKIQASIIVTDSIETAIDFVLHKQNEKKIRLSLHPFLESYYTKGLMSRQVKWYFKYNTWITITADSSLGLMDFKIYNRQGEAIKID